MKKQRLFTRKQFKTIVFSAGRGLGDFRSSKKSGLISEEFQNHIFLAVTEVNGCALCSYKHSKDALEMGMSDDDLQSYLTGDIENVDKEEGVALLFAQHYAEVGGDFSREAWDRVVKTYGLEKAKGIMGSIKVIMMGNAHGIALGALGSRLQRNPVVNSNLADELGVVFSMAVYLPAALISAAFVKKEYAGVY